MGEQMLTAGREGFWLCGRVCVRVCVSYRRGTIAWLFSFLQRYAEGNCPHATHD